MILLSLSLAFASQTATAAPLPVQPAPVSRALRDVPGVAITYHDLTEKDVKAITKALKKNKPLTPEQQRLMGASTNWNASPSMRRLTQNGICTVTSAQIDYKASVDLPRFNEAWVPAVDLPEWRAFIEEVEKQAAAKLWYPYDRLPNFEKAVVGKKCDQATKDGTAFMDQLKADAAAFQPTTAPPTATGATPAQ